MFTTQVQQIQVEPGVTINTTINTPHAPRNTPSPTLILLHYWGGSSRTWSAVNEILSEDYDTVAVDFRGWGQSTGPDTEDAYTIASHARDVEAVVSVLGLRHFVLVGLSMGAKVAQLIAGRGHLRGLQSIVLVSPAPPTPLVLDEKMREQQIHAYDDAQNARFVAENVLTASSPSENVLSELVEDMLKGNRFAKAAWPGRAMGEDISGVVGGINVPVLVVAAERDLVEPLERVRSQVQALIQGSELLVLSGSGHLSPIDKPKEVSQAIRSIL